MVGAEGTKIFYFHNPRSLQKALSGKELHQKSLLLTEKYFSKMLKKYYLGGFFWAPTLHKQYQNISGFTGDTCRILPDMGFAMESQELKELSFCVIFRKNK